MKINLSFVYRKYRKDIYEAVDGVLKDFPMLKERNIIVHMWPLDKRLGKSFASHRLIYGNELKHEIKLNPEAFLFSKIEDKIKSVRDANYESVKDIIWHELGHSLQIYLLCNYYNLSLNNYHNNIDQFYYSLTDAKANDICYEQHIKYFLSLFNWTNKKAEQLLGCYAIMEPVEFIPECVNNYYRLKNKDSLNKYDKEIFQFVKAVINDYRKYIK